MVVCTETTNHWASLLDTLITRKTTYKLAVVPGIHFLFSENERASISASQTQVCLMVVGPFAPYLKAQSYKKTI